VFSNSYTLALEDLLSAEKEYTAIINMIDVIQSIYHLDVPILICKNCKERTSDSCNNICKSIISK
jgi:hypothetical protein